MTDSTIEWTDKTWNPIRGCTRVSSGCVNCYAERTAARFAGPGGAYEGLVRIGEARWTGKVAFVEDKLDEPLRWRKPARIFVNSMSDLFHEDLTNEQIAAVFTVMALAEHHTFQVLTKRPKRMQEWFAWAAEQEDDDGVGGVAALNNAQEGPLQDRLHRRTCGLLSPYGAFCDCASPARVWPLPNVWLGVSVENQKAADERIPLLLATPAAVRFLSVEPLLGPVDLDLPRCETHDRDHVVQGPEGEHCNECAANGFSGEMPSGHWLDPLNGGIDWVIVGGESGPGARRCDLAWIRRVVADCAIADVPVFVKQLGAVPVTNLTATAETRDGPNGKRQMKMTADLVAIGDRKGGDPAEWPADLRVRQFPEVRR